MKRGIAQRWIGIAVAMVMVSTMMLISARPAAALAAWPIVQEGNSGSNVKAVQFLLRQHGSGIAADGAFGPGTKSAVASFQSSHGLTADGIVGGQTWSALVITVREGSSGEAVKAAQQLLVKNGHSVAVDGAFGPGTKSAAVSFQSGHGLTADGIVGAMTWQELAGSGNGSTPPAGGDRVSLAIWIRDSPRTILATIHSSGVSDSANARQEIVDTANGGMARRSCYGNAPCGSVWLQVSLLSGMKNLAGTYSYNISEIAGGSHSVGSRHYDGVAVDVNRINGSGVSSSNPYQSAFRSRCSALGATEVLGPGYAGHDTHVHCAWPRP